MTVAAVDASPHVTIDGTTTWFCCEGCRKAFEKNPARYAAAS
jgi:xanthine dehydrogenase accessory factor